jgi:hypothetical protein
VYTCIVVHADRHPSPYSVDWMPYDWSTYYILLLSVVFIPSQLLNADSSHQEQKLVQFFATLSIRVGHMAFNSLKDEQQYHELTCSNKLSVTLQ